MNQCRPKNAISVDIQKFPNQHSEGGSNEPGLSDDGLSNSKLKNYGSSTQSGTQSEPKTGV